MNMRFLHKTMRSSLLAGMALFAGAVTLTSCKEDISSDAYAIKEKDSMLDYIDKTDSLSLIRSVFSRAQLGRSKNASKMTSVLSARGNYTVFAPSNRVLQAYMDSVKNKKGATVAELDSIDIQRIALNCVIDNGSESAYELADFPTDNSTFSLANLNDRRLACRQVSLPGGDYAYFVNNNARVITSNIDVSNGVLHIVDHVISPSISTVGTLIQSAPNMKVMGTLLSLTGWIDSLGLQSTAEEAYETANLTYAGTKHHFERVGDIDYQAKRLVNYTAFVETDDIYRKEWGITSPADYTTITRDDKQLVVASNWETLLPQIEKKCEEILGTTEAHGKYTNPKNAVNRFVAYHLLDGGMDSKEFVHHFNEWGYKYGPDIKNPISTGYTVNVWDYFVTKGPERGLLKITQLPDANHALDPEDEYAYFLNRISTYDNSFTSSTYKEVSKIENDGAGVNGMNIKIDISGGESDNNAMNGFFFPINHILIYSPKARQELGSERIRFDLATILPELQSNDIRGRACRYFPRGYFSNLTNESQTTYVHYLQSGQGGQGGNWKDYQGDELLISGRYDFVIKLPPVPVTGTYELRMGTSNNFLRSMVQVYIGESPYSTQPVSLPIDQRESVDLILGGTVSDVSTWWKAEDADEATARERDRMLKNQGYMKAPKYFTVGNGEADQSCRDVPGNAAYGPAVRRILTTQRFDANKTYYLRFKSVISDDIAQLMLDYFELVPASVVNGAVSEDIW